MKALAISAAAVIFAYLLGLSAEKDDMALCGGSAMGLIVTFAWFVTMM